MKKIILASKSPRRKILLGRLNLDFEVITTDFNEEAYRKNNDFNIDFINTLSYLKALEVAKSLDFDALVIGADTVVVSDCVRMEKPHDFHEAFFMLKNLSNKTHEVYTSISIIDTTNNKTLTKTAKTEVKFKKLEDDEIKNYLNNSKPFDKAGSYGIQDFVTEENITNPPKESFIEKINGDYTNVMGLPVELLSQMLEEIS